MSAPVARADLAEHLLTELFPFHLQVGPDGRVQRRGAALARVSPGLQPGEDVAGSLVVTSPRSLSWQACADGHVPAGLVLLRDPAGPLVLRGQLVQVEGGVLFLGSPWVTSSAELAGLGLRLTDFAAADPVTDFLLLLQAQASALVDAQDLSAQLEASVAEQLHQAAHDALTGLPNRARFLDLLQAGVDGAQGRAEAVGVVLLDLDRFQEVNDTLGHRYGDGLLQELGPRLRGVLREGEVLARMGGDEFAVLVRCPAAGDAAVVALRAVASRLLTALQEPFLVEEVVLTVEASAGVAVAPQHGETAEALLQHADTAMYQAKQVHEDVSVYDPSADGYSPRKLSLLTQLRGAGERGELVLHYQPLVDLASGRTGGVEALVRWQHPQEGLLPPGVFLPLAEGSGLIHDLTREVLLTACRQARQWQRAGRCWVVAVNLSARCLVDASLPDDVAGCLELTGLPASLLKLEITESAIIADPVRASRVIARLHALGVGLSIDDFGTGYTSLASLRDLPVQELKIDRSFVTGMLGRPRDAAIVRTGVELAARLGLRSVAEGIEDTATRRALAALGCTTGQGYALGRPVPADHLDPGVGAEAVRAAAAGGPRT